MGLLNRFFSFGKSKSASDLNVKEVFELIDTIESQPLTKAATEAVAVIVEYGNHSDVNILIHSAFVEKKHDAGGLECDHLLGYYIAGVLKYGLAVAPESRSQLDGVESGIKMLLLAYRYAKGQSLLYSVPLYEKLDQLQKSNSLRVYIHNVLKKK